MGEMVPQTEIGHASPRVGDAERNVCADTLTQELMAGRLREEEFDQRVEQALRAQTRQDLSSLTADLASPSSEAARSVQRRSPEPVISLSRRDVVAASVFTAAIGVITFFIGMQANYGDAVLAWLELWLFGLVSGAVGALLARGRRIE